MESAVKGAQKSFHYSSFLYSQLFKEKTHRTFSTPFACTEIIAHVKTLKYFAVASKINVATGGEKAKLPHAGIYDRSHHCFDFFCVFCLPIR